MTVWADSEEAAERMVGEFSWTDRLVRWLLDVDGPPPELWLLNRGPFRVWDAGTDLEKGVIGLTRGFHDSTGLVAHELTHWYLLRWPAKLPTLVEEGLADLVARTTLGLLEEGEVAYDGPAADPSCLGMSEAEFRNIGTREETSELRALGYQVAAREGIGGLLALCRQANAEGLEQVPLERFER
jgi:hypothetical protein